MAVRFEGTFETVMHLPISIFTPPDEHIPIPSSVIDLSTTTEYVRFHRYIGGQVKVEKHEILDDPPPAFHRIHIPFTFLQTPWRLKGYLYDTLLHLNLFNSKLLDIDKLATMMVVKALGDKCFTCGFCMVAKVTACCMVMVNEEVENFMKEWGLVDDNEEEAFGTGEEEQVAS